MQPALAFDIGGMCFFGGIKGSEMDGSALVGQVRDEFCPSAVHADAKGTGSVIPVVASPVLHVAAAIGYPEVLPSIVGSVAIAMIYQSIRPLSGHVEPCEAVCVPARSADSDFNVPKFRKASGLVSDIDAGRSLNQSPEYSCSGVVTEQFAQVACGQFDRWSGHAQSYGNGG
jgi:hypothetical protein